MDHITIVKTYPEKYTTIDLRNIWYIEWVYVLIWYKLLHWYPFTRYLRLEELGSRTSRWAVSFQRLHLVW